MRLLVCGGRDFTNVAIVTAVLDEWHRRRRITALIHGAARGADTLAGQWARSRGVVVEPYPVTSSEWSAWKAAGRPRPSPGAERNARMLERGQPDAVLAFPGGAGTRDMMNRAAIAVPVARVVVDGPRWRVERVSLGYLTAI